MSTLKHYRHIEKNSCVVQGLENDCVFFDKKLAFMQWDILLCSAFYLCCSLLPIFIFSGFLYFLLLLAGKGGKNRRRGKNENEGLKRELVFKEDGQGKEHHNQMPLLVFASFKQKSINLLFRQSTRKWKRCWVTGAWRPTVLTACAAYVTSAGNFGRRWGGESQ